MCGRQSYKTIMQRVFMTMRACVSTCGVLTVAMLAFSLTSAMACTGHIGGSGCGGPPPTLTFVYGNPMGDSANEPALEEQQGLAVGACGLTPGPWWPVSCGYTNGMAGPPKPINANCVLNAATAICQSSSECGVSTAYASAIQLNTPVGGWCQIGINSAPYFNATITCTCH
jgi:hypothetical protein